jgi:hypothetical protein
VHTENASLWVPASTDVHIALDLFIEVLRERRGESWPEWLHDLQVKRLAAANAAADLRLDSGAMDAPAMIAAALAFLKRTAGA